MKKVYYFSFVQHRWVAKGTKGSSESYLLMVEITQQNTLMHAQAQKQSALMHP